MDDSDNPGEVRLRRFTLIAGTIFFIYICGDVDLESKKFTLLWLGEIKLKNIFVIKGTIWGIAIYACCLFIYRECFQKYLPFQIRGWFKKYGVIVEFTGTVDAANKRDKYRDLALSEFIESLGNSPQKIVKEMIQEVPFSYYKDFMISINSSYHKKHTAIIRQVKNLKFEQYFPFINDEDLAIEPSNDYHGYKRVRIKKLRKKTKLFATLEDFIYLLPLIPFVFSVICVASYPMITIWESLF